MQTRAGECGLAFLFPSIICFSMKGKTLSKFSKFIARLNIFFNGKKRSSFRTPRILALVLLIIIFTIDFLSIWLSISSVLAALFAYLSALILLIELLGEAWLKLGPQWISRVKKANAEKPQEDSARKIDPVLFWTATFFWFVSPVLYFLRNILGLSPCYSDWLNNEERAIDVYKLRFYAFISLILAINFDVCSRLFK